MGGAAKEDVMSGWDRSPLLFIGVVEGDLAKKRNEVAVDLLQTIISASPIDEGAFKGNHRVSVDGEDRAFDENEKEQGETGAYAGTAVLARGVSIIEGAQGPYHSITIQNNAPYAQALENGHSQQAPHGVYITSFNFVREKHRE